MIILTAPVCSTVTDLEQITIQKGLVHHKFIKIIPRGPVKVNILEIDPKAGYTVKPALAQKGTIWGREKLGGIINKSSAIAGINGNYFQSNGLPIGALAIDQEWITGPVLNRAAISVNDQGLARFARPKLRGIIQMVDIPDDFNGIPYSQDITNLNQLSSFNSKGISFYNHWWEDKIPCGQGKACLLVDQYGTIRLKISTQDSVTPLYPTRSDYVLLSYSNEHFSHLKKKDKIKINWYSDPDWAEMKHVIGGGPYLISQGKSVLNETLENFSRSSGIRGSAPRSVFGMTNSGRLIFLTADGRQKSSVGLSLEELVDLLLDLGLVEAINLDGGGSTTMIINGRTVNNPSDRTGARPVSTALLVFKKGNESRSQVLTGGP